MKIGEILYFADTDKDRVVEVEFKNTQTDIFFEENKNMQLSQNVQSVMDSIYYVNIPMEGTMYISKDFLFKTKIEASEKLNEYKEEIYVQFDRNDGWIKEIIKTYNNGTPSCNVLMFREFLVNDKEKVIHDFLIPWFEENDESEVLTSIMNSYVLLKTGINIENFL